MKIAITADCHLRSDASGSERLTAFEKILGRMLELEISTLIIAGDLFDKDANNYSKFEDVIGRKKFSGIEIFTVRGNHDINIHPSQFRASNFHVIDKPRWIGKDTYGVNILFIPYLPHSKMAVEIEKMEEPRVENRWVLISHGSFLQGNRDVDPYEKGIYMPLLGADIQQYKPSKVFIGHIHKPFDSNKVVIPGSPCGLDITESGKRSFIVFDTTTLEYEREIIDSEIIFINDELSMIPSDHEEEFIKKEMQELFARWQIDTADRKKIVLRLAVCGYSSNVRNAKKWFDSALEGVKMYKNHPIDFTELKISNDKDRDFIIKQFEDLLEKEVKNQNVNSEFVNAIKRSALELVYGE